MTESLAGQGQTRVVAATLDELRAALLDVAYFDPNEPVGVVVQPFLDGDWAGAAFSTDPVQLDKDTMVVEWTRGRGERLMGASEMDGRISWDLSRVITRADEWPLAVEELEILRQQLIDVEGLLGGPVDVEWVANRAGKLVIVQVRPVVLPTAGTYPVDATDDFSRLPGMIAAHPKLAIRQVACRLGVPLDGATVVMRSMEDGESSCGIPALDRFVAAKSVVLLHPREIDSKVVREFGSLNDGGVEFFTAGCRRYAVRDYPAQSTFRESVSRLLGLGALENWAPTVVVKDVLCADVTGIARIVGQDVLVELAQGHFVPRGVVETSVFLLREDGSVETLKEEEQHTAFRFVNGHVLSESPITCRVDFSPSLIQSIAATFQPLLRAFSSVAVEFGVIVRDDCPFIYLIDWAEEDAESRVPTESDARYGILSSGCAEGRVIPISGFRPNDTRLDAYLDEDVTPDSDAEARVFLCDRPSSNLLPMVRSVPSGSGFVFRHSSMLCHVAVVLRERGLAAVTVDEGQWNTLIGSAYASIEAGGECALIQGRNSRHRGLGLR